MQSFTDSIRVKQTFRQKHPLVHDGMVVHLKKNGDIERTTYKSIQLKGSDSTSLQYRTDGYCLSTSGNHGRFNRPDNVFNYGLDHWKLIINNVNRELGLPAFTGGETYLTESRDRHGVPKYSRCNDGAHISEIHQTCNLFAGSHQNGLDFIHSMSMVNINRQTVKSYPTGATWGGGSRFKSSKLYDKASDLSRLISSGKLADNTYMQKLIDFCRQNGLIRYEVQFRDYLHRNSLSFWNEATQNNINSHFQKELSLMAKEKLILDHSKIPLATLGVYMRYIAGENMRTALTNRTFYRHRSILLDYGIDIKEKLNVKILPVQQRIIQLKPAIMPDWYYLPEVKPNQSIRLLGDFNQLDLCKEMS